MFFSEKTPNLSNSVDTYAFNVISPYLLKNTSYASSWHTLQRSDLEDDRNFSQKILRVSSENILSLHDATSYAYNFVYLKGPVSNYWNSHLVQSRDSIRAVLEKMGIPYNATIYKKGHLWNKDYLPRLQFIADTDISDQQRRLLASKLRIPSDEKISHIPEERQMQVYRYFQEQLEYANANIADSRLLDIVYKTYRDGRYASAQGIRKFDASIHFLLSQGDLEISGDGRTVTPSTHRMNTDIYNDCFKQVNDWYGIYPTDKRATPLFTEEIQSAAERVGMHLMYTKRNMFDNYNNVGSILHLLPIFTERTRLWVASTGQLASAYKSQSKLRHPDQNAVSDESFKLLNAANNILSDPTKFRKWQAGAYIYSL